MTPDQAAWVRKHVLPRTLVETQGSFLHRCACQKGNSEPCRAGRHGDCAHHKHARYYAQGQAETNFGRSYSPWSVTWPGFISVDVWLADRVCAWRCPCDCHTAAPSPATPEQVFTEPEAWNDGALFDLEAPF